MDFMMGGNKAELGGHCSCEQAHATFMYSCCKYCDRNTRSYAKLQNSLRSDSIFFTRVLACHSILRLQEQQRLPVRIRANKA